MTKKIIYKVTSILLVIFLCSCGVDEEKPSYKEIENTLPDSKLVIKWSRAKGFENQSEIFDSLMDIDRDKFSQSLSWVVTESNIELPSLNGKTAKQLVDITNCLKTSTIESKCIDSQ